MNEIVLTGTSGASLFFFDTSGIVLLVRLKTAG